MGEGEWLREVEERAGESRRALWGKQRIICDIIPIYQVRDKRKTLSPLGQRVCLQVPTDPFLAGQDPETHLTTCCYS